MSQPKPIKLTYDEPQMAAPAPGTTRLDTIYGNIPRVSAAPTWKPKTFKDSFALYVNGADYRLYVYMGDNTWRYSALT